MSLKIFTLGFILIAMYKILHERWYINENIYESYLFNHVSIIYLDICVFIYLVEVANY